jgi:hypothetical protein
MSLPDAVGIEAKAELTGELERVLALLAVDAARDFLVLAALAHLAGDVNTLPEMRKPGNAVETWRPR